MSQTRSSHFVKHPDLEACANWITTSGPRWYRANGKDWPLAQGAAYARFYPAMLTCARRLCEAPSADAFIGLAHLSYGWMPTILKSVSVPQSVSRFVDAARGVSCLSEAERFLADHCQAPPINNSWVGTSKLLHFISPDGFPIWDSRVATHFKAPGAQGNPATTPVKRQKSYLAYLAFCHENKDLAPVADFQNLYQRDWGTCGRLRALEFMLFITPPDLPEQPS